MRILAAIDIGGTSIKFALWKNGRLEQKHARATPNNLNDFYKVLVHEVMYWKEREDLAGVAISTPGAVNKATGVIEGASALPYIHHFNIQKVLEERFALPVSMENDANCAALAELAEGAAKGVNSAALVVIGTGIGGSLILGKKIWHGAHLHGGEFGFMKVHGEKSLSYEATPVQMAKRYNEVTHKSLTGEEVFELADNGDDIAKTERAHFINQIAEAIFNIQHSFDPERILLGGGVSNNFKLLPLVQEALQALRSEYQQQLQLETLDSDIRICKWQSGANLRGAVEDFYQTYC